MASINNIEIKNIKNFRNHEGATIAQGNVYYRGKKLGFWSQDSYGGCDSYDFDTRILDEEVMKYRNSQRVEDKYRDLTDLDILLYDLVNVADKEKQYKKGVKKGYSTYVEASDGYHVMGYYTNAETPEEEDYYRQFVNDCKKAFFKDRAIEPKIYRSLDDFRITC